MKWPGSFLVILLMALALACNAPVGSNETPSPPPTNTSASTPESDETSQPPTETPTAALEETAEATPTSNTPPTSLPTFTPIQSTVSATVSPSETPFPLETTVPTQTSIPTANASPTKAADTGPLNFTFSINWEVNSSNSAEAIATVSIVATGGGGDYQYFRDDLSVDGPVIRYTWSTCRANPGSLRVTSADGQSLKIDYFEQPPCPTS
jgi:cytoskeletal protein RodZ